MEATATNEEKVGIVIHKCDFERVQFVCQPTVTVFLVDNRTGDDLVHEADNENKSFHRTTRSFISSNYLNRQQSPIWEETLTYNYKFDEISVKKSSKLLFLFEINDVVVPDVHKNPAFDIVKGRLAWAFLKPIGSDGSLNIGKKLRLQLFKVRKRCKTSHETCPIFHLYSEHKRKKFPGTIFVTIKAVKDVNILKHLPEQEVEMERNAKETTTNTSVDVEKVKIEVAKWSRLPTQSCKIPNCKIAELAVSHKGVSSLSFSHSGLFLACGSSLKLYIFDVCNWKTVAKLNGHTGLIYEISWNFDDTLLLSVSADRCAMIWSIKPISTAPLFVLPHPSFIYCGKWIMDKLGLITGGKDGVLRFWNKKTEGFELLQECLAHKGYVSAVETGRNLLICSGDSSGYICLWTFEDSKWHLARILSLREIIGNVIDTIHIHPGQRRIVITSRMNGSVMVDISAGVVVQTYKAAHETMRATTCLTPCGSLLFTISSNVNVWEFDTGKLVATYQHIFPDLSHAKNELSGHVMYHPHEHLAAFSILGCNCPVVILQYNHNKDMSERLGLKEAISKIREQNKITEGKKGELQHKQGASINRLETNDSATNEKLAAIVRNIDKILAAKRHMKGQHEG